MVKCRVMWYPSTQTHHRQLHIHSVRSKQLLWMWLTTLVNDPSEHRYTSFKLTKGNYATEAVLTSRSPATSLRYPEINGRGMNSVPHQRCMGTGNSIWTSRTHQVRRLLLHQVVRIRALPVGKRPTKFLPAEAQPPSGGTTTIT